MKANKIITTALLSSLVLGAFATITQADSVAPSEGSVTIGDGSLVPGEDDKDPEKPTDPVDTEDVTDGGTGSLTILGVSNLRFGKVESAAKKIDQPAEAKIVKAKDTGVAKTVGNYVQFGDIRTEEHGYVLTAQMTKQFTSPAGKTLTNATIKYTNSILTHEDAKTAGVIHPELESLVVAEMELTDTVGDLKKVIDYKGTEGGKGIYSVEYGQSPSYSDQFTVGNTSSAPGTEANSVFLNIPKATATNMTKGDYTAEVTWTLSKQTP